MTAERLRLAATRLRELAENSTPGPWETRPMHEAPSWLEDDDRLVAPVGRECPIQPGGGEAGDYGMSIGDAAYIAAMHPPVAAVTAKLLDAIADIHDGHGRTLDVHRQIENEGGDCGCAYKDCYDCGKWHNCTHREPLHMTEALAVADAILGES